MRTYITCHWVISSVQAEEFLGNLGRRIWAWAGWGKNLVSCGRWHWNASNRTPPNFGGAASTWSTARPPSSHAVRASGRSEQPRSRTDATSSGSRRCLLRSLLRKTREASFWESSKCGSPPLWIGRGGAAAWEDGGRAVLQVRLFVCGNPPRRIGRGGAAAWEVLVSRRNQPRQARGL
jgi:hypothetical protein